MAEIQRKKDEQAKRRKREEVETVMQMWMKR
jgi:hypothetical protein